MSSRLFGQLEPLAVLAGGLLQRIAVSGHGIDQGTHRRAAYVSLIDVLFKNGRQRLAQVLDLGHGSSAGEVGAVDCRYETVHDCCTLRKVDAARGVLIGLLSLVQRIQLSPGLRRRRLVPQNGGAVMDGGLRLGHRGPGELDTGQGCTGAQVDRSG